MIILKRYKRYIKRVIRNKKLRTNNTMINNLYFIVAVSVDLINNLYPGVFINNFDIVVEIVRYYIRYRYSYYKFKYYDKVQRLYVKRTYVKFSMYDIEKPEIYQPIVCISELPDRNQINTRYLKIVTANKNISREVIANKCICAEYHFNGSFCKIL